MAISIREQTYVSSVVLKEPFLRTCRSHNKTTNEKPSLYSIRFFKQRFKSFGQWRAANDNHTRVEPILFVLKAD